VRGNGGDLYEYGKVHLRDVVLPLNPKEFERAAGTDHSSMKGVISRLVDEPGHKEVPVVCLETAC